MIDYADCVLVNFPRSEHAGMVASIKQSMYRLLKYCILCDKKYYKKNTLVDMDAEKQYIQAMIGIASNREHRYMSLKKYEVWSKYLVKIGNNIGARITADSRRKS